MDSEKDATTQLTSLTRPGFCEKPYCLGDTWHNWGCCSNSIVTSIHDRCVQNQCASSVSTAPPSSSSAPPSVCVGATSVRFAKPKTEEEIERARQTAVPKRQGRTLPTAFVCGSHGLNTEIQAQGFQCHNSQPW